MPDYSKWKSQFYTAKDALLKREPPTYIVESLLPLPSLTIFYGISGSLKTNLVLDMAICVASGKRWLDPLPSVNGATGYDTHKSSILWIDVDSGLRVLHTRIGAMLRARKIRDKDISFTYASFLTPPFIATQSPAIAHLVSTIKDTQSKLVVFDNLSVIAGGLDENSNQMVQVMSSLRSIAESTNTAVIAIHHDAKHENGSRKTPRGHSSIEAALDAALCVKREDDTVSIVATKARNEPIESFAALWTWEPGEKHGQLEEARFWGIESEVDEKTRQAHEVIYKALSSGPLSQSEIVEKCKGKMSKGKCLSALQFLEHKNKLKVNANGKHNRKVYSL